MEYFCFGGAGDIHIAFTGVQLLAFFFASSSVGFGVYVPIHISIKCKLYHWWIPSFSASLSATSSRISSNSSIISPLGSPAMSLSHEPTEVGSEDEPEVVGEVSWPRLEVLSYLLRLVAVLLKGMMRAYSDDIKVLHEIRLRTCEKAQHRQHESRERANQGNKN